MSLIWLLLTRHIETKMNQINGKLCKAPCMPGFALDKGQPRPPQGSAALTLKPPDPQAQIGRTHTHRDQAKRSFLEPFLVHRVPASTGRAVLDGGRDLCPENRRSIFAFRTDVLDSFQSKCMIEQRGGHVGYPLGLVTEESNPCSTSFSIVGTH